MHIMLCNFLKGSSYIHLYAGLAIWDIANHKDYGIIPKLI